MTTGLTHIISNTLVDYFTGVPEEETSKALTTIVLSRKAGTPPARPEGYGHANGWTFKSIEDYTRIGFMTKRNSPHLDTPRP